ncbi:hypothetical protein MDA_GLEAN10009257 [Myotis davidii]|uniref:Uncharacterized protein n=1 Tax=Myotis davidii TaxID=225400 RepID=L5LFJ5_MYODS|nr:hypothetical protein MDA_GLEAN10009257 [Myotis davidii]
MDGCGGGHVDVHLEGSVSEAFGYTIRDFPCGKVRQMITQGVAVEDWVWKVMKFLSSELEL